MLSIAGYVHKFKINVDGQEVLFEPDEENNYRARVNYEDTTHKKDVDASFLKAITLSIETLFK